MSWKKIWLCSGSSSFSSRWTSIAQDSTGSENPNRNRVGLNSHSRARARARTGDKNEGPIAGNKKRWTESSTRKRATQCITVIRGATRATLHSSRSSSISVFLFRFSPSLFSSFLFFSFLLLFFFLFFPFLFLLNFCRAPTWSFTCLPQAWNIAWSISLRVNV